MRDTGAAQSILLNDALPNINKAFTGEKVLIADLTSNASYPLAQIYLQCPLITSPVKIAVRAGTLPVKGVQLLLGNDLAGKLVVPNVVTVNQPLSTLSPDPSDVFPVCAVTRSQTQKISQTTTPSRLPSTPFIPDLLSKDQLIKSQETDPSLTSVRHVASDKKDLDTLPVFYYDQGVLMRAYRPPRMLNNDAWSEIHQIVLPTSVRTHVLKLAHNSSGGHLGYRKTYQKILDHFFWPGIKRDVNNFVRTCDVCQLYGKVNQPITPAPMCPIPVVHEPFEKIIIDCVGPLPKTKQGNQYLLTVMDSTTRYPEAFPLKSITAKAILKPLLHMFTSKGIPRQIQTDRGTNFTSTTFKQVLAELGVEHVTSSAYHPQSQGCLERFHQTLKQVLGKYCYENGTTWDDHLDWLLFAFRESLQESLGFSPFEVLYGRNVRGPLKVLKDKWFESHSQPLTVQEYVSSLMDKLAHIRNFAKNNLNLSQIKSKQHYDKKAIPREFLPGQQVLVFLPVPGAPLTKKYSGPYVVEKRLNPVNYVVATPDRRKKNQLVHVNLMKPYFCRNPEEISRKPIVNKTGGVVPDGPSDATTAVALCMGLDTEMGTGLNAAGESEDFNNLPSLPSHKDPLSNSVILDDLANYYDNLSPNQLSDLAKIFQQYPSVTSDTPGCCTYLFHDIKLNSSCESPIRQTPYRLNPARKKIMDQEIAYLLNNNLAEPSMSPWASPCLLVPKPDGSHRLCTDYRKVNRVTIRDSYPLPVIDDLVDRIGYAKFITTVDLMKGYYQIPLTPHAREISAFITHSGLYQYKVLPFGMCNAPASFQRVMDWVTRDLQGTSAYLDDLVVVADTWEDHVDRLHHLFERLLSAGLTINLRKCVFGKGSVTYLGHCVGGGLVRPKTANVSAILSFPTPRTRKDVMRFLGMAGYYRKFCHNFAEVAAPLTLLTSKKEPFHWTTACETSFNHLKTFLSAQPVLRTPDFDKPFHLQVDASGVGVGGVLLQDHNNILHPVAYFSNKLKPYQRDYSTIEKEALALVLAIQKFECYLQTSPHVVKVYSDHNPIVFINSMKPNNQRILRWAVLLQPYNIQVNHIKGTDNIFADCLSRGFID